MRINANLVERTSTCRSPTAFTVFIWVSFNCTSVSSIKTGWEAVNAFPESSFMGCSIHEVVVCEVCEVRLRRRGRL
ncbi:hypothetical protein Plhal304r1_c004g0017731 [Plasmopara halstedii]